MKIVFLGNHTVGVRVLEVLRDNTQINLTGIIAHPVDSEDGVVYESVYQFAIANSIPVIRGVGKSKEVNAFITDLAPDLIWVTDYRYILPNSLLDKARMGGINFHPSLLPQYRGRAPINWAILNGEEKIGLTVHWIAEGVDDGDILEQKSFILGEDEDVGVALKKIYPLYQMLSRNIIRRLSSNNLKGVKQDVTGTQIFPARKPEDGEIDWKQPVRDVYNLIRAVARPYPGAFTELSKSGYRLYIWKAKPEVVSDNSETSPGVVREVHDDGSFLVQCIDGALDVLIWSYDTGISGPIQAGLRFGKMTSRESII